MIDELLSVEILLVPHTSSDEISNLIKREEIISLANTRFIEGKISFQDYIDCLEVAGVCIDDYLLTVENNLTTVGIL